MYLLKTVVVPSILNPLENGSGTTRPAWRYYYYYVYIAVISQETIREEVHAATKKGEGCKKLFSPIFNAYKKCDQTLIKTFTSTL